MSIAQAIKPHLSSLRRYARALSGSQTGGDGYVVTLLEALVADASMFPAGIAPKIGLYRLFLRRACMSFVGTLAAHAASLSQSPSWIFPAHGLATCRTEAASLASCKMSKRRSS